MARGAFSETMMCQQDMRNGLYWPSLLYNGVTMEAAPTPRPAMNLPTKMAAM
jgi:hypothetical protein